MPYESKEIGCKASPETRVYFKEKRLAVGDLIVDAAKPLKLDRL